MLITTWLHYRRRNGLSEHLVLAIEGGMNAATPATTIEAEGGSHGEEVVDDRVEEMTRQTLDSRIEELAPQTEDEYKENLYKGIL